MKIALLIVLALSVPVLAIDINGRAEHPTIYLCKEDIARAKANRAKYDWAKTVADKLVREADDWAGKTDDEIVKLIPPAGACFGYGFSGCPVCGGTLKSWWGQGGVASLDDPGHIRCVNGHRLPDDAHPDPGDGWTAPDGKKFYFVGTYNSYVIDTLTTAITKLVHAYALTADKQYANKAALILDHFARIYPSCDKGSWDYPSSPTSGRFNRPLYQVARMLIYYANDYDILLMGKALDAPSSVAGISRRENVEKNLLLNGAKYCYDRSLEHPALNNGQADFIRGAMVVGVAMGIPQYVAWGVDGPYGIRNMLANNIDRDGQYYETSALYSHHSRYLYMDMAEILQRYADAAHPNGIKLVKDPAFVAFNLLPNTRIRCTTMPPSLGDDAPHTTRIAATTQPDRSDVASLEHLRAMNDDAALAERLDRHLVELCEGDIDRERARSGDAGEWLLFHAKDVPIAARGKVATQPARASQSDLLSQKGLAILRAGAGENARAATLRFGPTLNHGHLDEMNLNVYARSYELSYDLGYSLGSTHTQVGWAHQTASHNTVVVDEKSQLQTDGSGGSVKHFVALPGVTLVRAAAPACYASQHVKRYERTVAMIDVSPESGYLLDIFRVEGGSKHDYVFHALGTDAAVDGATLGEPRAGSLAGAEIDTGGKIGSDGDVNGVTNKPYWNPPPGNGYGFLISPRAIKADGAWSATWTCDAEAPARLRLTILPQPGDEPMVCEAPGIYPKMPRSKYVVVRRHGENLASTFVSMIEPFGDKPVVQKVERLECDGDGLAVKVTLADGRADVIMCSWSGQAIRLRPQRLSSNATFSLVRLEGGRPTQVTMVEGSELEATTGFPLPEPAIERTIESVDYEHKVLVVNGGVPRTAKGEFAFVSNPAYAQDSAYRIESIEPRGEHTAIHLAPTRLTLARAHLDKSPTNPKVLPNIVPLEYGKALGHKAGGFFTGKRIAVPAGGTNTRITGVDADGLAVRVENSSGFKAGDDLTIYDVYSGDHLRIPCWIQASPYPSGQWNVTSNVSKLNDK